MFCNAGQILYQPGMLCVNNAYGFDGRSEVLIGYMLLDIGFVVFIGYMFDNVWFEVVIWLDVGQFTI